MRTYLTIFAAAAVLGAALPAAAAERINVELPRGYKVVHQQASGGLAILEMIPEAETLESWTTMVTAQRFPNHPRLEPVTFIDGLAARLRKDCGDTFDVVAIAEDRDRPPSAQKVLACSRMRATGRPLTIAVKTIKGRDAFYSVQIEFRAAPTRADAERWNAYLQRVSLSRH